MNKNNFRTTVDESGKTRRRWPCAYAFSVFCLLADSRRFFLSTGTLRENEAKFKEHKSLH